METPAHAVANVVAIPPAVTAASDGHVPLLAPATITAIGPHRFWWLLILSSGLIWAAVDLVLGAVVAPVPFSLVGGDGGLTRDQAGQLFGVVLERWAPVASVLAGLMALGLGMAARSWRIAGQSRRIPRNTWRILALLLLAVTALAIHHLAESTVREGNALAAERRARSRAGTSDDAADARFGELHQRSRGRFLAETAAALVAAIVAGTALVRAPAPVPDPARPSRI